MKVIGYKYLPARLPVLSTLVCWLMLDRFHVQGTWIAGVVYTWLAIAWIATLICFWFQCPFEPRSVD